MNKITVADSILNEEKDFVYFNFYDDNKIVESSPLCGLTLRHASSMRFRWEETNPTRDNVLANIVKDLEEKDSIKRSFVPVQLGHTKIVYDVKEKEDTLNKIGDGIITVNKRLIPTVTVADCVPIYFFDKKSKAFGIVHSGWKGTGIIENAIKLCCDKYNSSISDFYVLIGPSIKNCCYIVNEERADYFISNFSKECVSELEDGVLVDWNNGNGKLYRLALDKANIAVLRQMGVTESHITVCGDCTSCNSLYGSNRRETTISKKPDMFTVMAAYIAW